MTTTALVFTMTAEDLDGPDAYAERRYVVRLGDHVVWTDTETSSMYDDTRERERAEERFAEAIARVLGPQPPYIEIRDHGAASAQ